MIRTVALTELPLPVALAITAAKEALEHAPQTCRFHGDCPPAKPGPHTGRCDSCEQPARVRRALAYFRGLTGEEPPARRYVVDTASAPHRVSGGYRVLGHAGGTGVSGLWVPADPGLAAALIIRTLEERGEVGPFELQVSLNGAPR